MKLEINGNEYTIGPEANLTGANLTGANLTKADLTGANLTGANLTGANLDTIKHDIWAIFAMYPYEVLGVQRALVAGQIDGSAYSGECACLIGTIANIKNCLYYELRINPNANRPAERWFLGIRTGQTPENCPIARITNEWIEEWLQLPLGVLVQQPQTTP